MAILFSPSEGKEIYNTESFNLQDLPFSKELFPLRKGILQRYVSILNADKPKLCTHTGIKNDKELEELRKAHLDLGLSALFRYNGIAYKCLNPKTLNKSSLEFLNHNLIIFSNLFGPVFGGSLVPYYKLKQGQSLDGLKIESDYRPLLGPLLDDYLSQELVIDLRAGFYEKFYSPKITYITMQFFKNGKKVSHWAKAYRGYAVRELALAQPKTQDEFESISFAGLQIKEIIRQKNATHYCFNIIDSL